MKERDLLLDPCWSIKDLGKPIPDSPHAVSVALPRWEDVIAYEEKEPECINALKAVYPRFGFNPLIKEIVNCLIKEKNLYGKTAWPFPNELIAEKARLHCLNSGCKNGNCIINFRGLSFLITDINVENIAKEFWQHTGLGASSRQAAIALNKEQAPNKEKAEIAKQTLRTRLSNIYSCKSELISLFPSGMAAFFTALQALSKLNPNRQFLQLGFPYVDVLKLPQVIFNGGELLLNTNPDNLAKELENKKPAAIVIEIPSNPMLKCINLPKISKISHEKGIPIIVDDTIGMGVNVDCLPYADIIFSSLTKSFAGRGDILAGGLIISQESKWYKELFQHIQDTKITELSDADAIELEKVSRDVKERSEKQNIACLSLKNKLEKHPAISRVFHPENCSNFKDLMRKNGGYGCLLSFELAGDLKKTKLFYDALEVCKGPSLGTKFTLACPYVQLAHYQEIDWARNCGIPPNLIRVSVGLEDHEILWDKFEKALNLSEK